MSVRFPSEIEDAVWSPCNKFIAIAWGRPRGGVDILDAATLGQLCTLPVDGTIRRLMFSPDTRSLTWFGWHSERIISWDVQTGVLVSLISLEPLSWPEYHSEITYSTCGTMVGLFSRKAGITTISTYNILSGTHIYSHSVQVKVHRLAGVWAHGECLQFAAKEPGTLTTWEVGFTSPHTLAKVKSLSIPHEFYKFQSSYNPTLSRLISNDKDTVCVWDTEHSKHLLSPMQIRGYSRVYISSSGPFFVWGNSGVELWKESPTGYILHQRFISHTSGTTPHMSPNGELVLTFGGSVAQLWHTRDSNTPAPTISTQSPQNDRRFSFLGLSPDTALAAVIQRGGEVVTVLDLESGIPRLIIDTGMVVCGLGMAGSTVVVVGYGKIVTWSLPARGCVPNPSVNIDDSIKITTFDQARGGRWNRITSVSPDLRHVVFTSQDNDTIITSGLDIYDVLTGQHLGHGNGGSFKMCSFTPDGDEVWHVNGSSGDGWKILKDGGSNTTGLEHLGRAVAPTNSFPWQCPPNYKVTDDGWILHSSGKRLLWLPPHWWPEWWDRAWHGQFLVLLNDELPELLILELK